MQDITPPNPNSFRPFEEGLKFISNCPVCQHQYNPIEAKILTERENAHLLYIKCQRCQAGILALVRASQMGLSSIGLITDLDSHEVSKFRSPISADAVLDIHQAITSGMIARLLVDRQAVLDE
jgi:hypothetical protein